MDKEITSSTLALRLWLLSASNFALGITAYLFYSEDEFGFTIFPFVFMACIICSFPALIALIIFQPIIQRFFVFYKTKITALLSLFFLTAIAYGLLISLITDYPFNRHSSLQSFFLTAGVCISSVFAATLAAFFINLQHIKNYFQSPLKKIYIMEESLSYLPAKVRQTSYANKLWVKGLITAGLILLMLIPTVFVSNLVEERQQRQQEVKNEVSSKWSGAQNITFPYLYVPYNASTAERKSFVILPENLNVNCVVTTEQRKRSIYSVLLYNSSLAAEGNFNIKIPEGINDSAINWNDIKICFGISDFKGIEQKITTTFNKVNYDLSAGLPITELDSNGLSAPVVLSANDIGREIYFSLPLKIKGSDQLHFSPFAGSSNFSIKSGWNSPSFDGNTLPNERHLSNNGFVANWNFNKANLPFNTVLKDFNFKKNDYTFGVSLLQPADQYAKTMRSVKYAILFIGLTFSLFFIVEIMQRKPFHPVQYVLVGLALVIFFTLLLSISEFLLFDVAYFIAAIATVLLITLYAKSHFKSWKIAGFFAAVIGAIYGFIFVLIRLEDTALLVGSIGLFIILALAMYASRKINWYGNTLAANAAY